MDRRASAAIGGRARPGRQYRNRGPVCHEDYEPDALEYATAVCQRGRRLWAVRGGSADNTSQRSPDCPSEWTSQSSAKWLSSASTIDWTHQLHACVTSRIPQTSTTDFKYAAFKAGHMLRGSRAVGLASKQMCPYNRVKGTRKLFHRGFYWR